MKNIKDDSNRWGNIPCSWIGRINVVKMSIILKAIFRFSASPIKLPEVFFTNNFEFVWRHTHTHTHNLNGQSNLKKEE